MRRIALIAVSVLALSTSVWAQDQEEVGEPEEPAPSEAPPPPPANIPPPPGIATSEEPPPPAPSDSEGQWVYTGQYGWTYMPYAQPYTYVAPSGELAYTYVYGPGLGWRWALSPWVLGWGPRPWWGVRSYRRFVWYAHPWFRVGVYRPRVWGAAVHIHPRYYRRVAPVHIHRGRR
jgi:hypothetical protein